MYYEAIAVRTAGLKEIQVIMNESQLKLKQAKDDRSLSHCNAVEALRKSFKAVVFSLSREASERTCATAAGLQKFLTTYNSIATIQMMSDILPHLNILSKLFQKEDIENSIVKPGIQATVDALNALLDELGKHTSCFHSGELDELMTECGVTYSEDDKGNFRKKVYQPYIHAVIRNIQNRFPSCEVLTAFKIFDPSLAPAASSKYFTNYGSSSLQILSDQFDKTLPDCSDLTTEWLQAKSVIATDMKESHTQPEIMTVMATKYRETSPNLSLLAAIGAVIPVSNAECDRGFSTLGRIKTTLRNRLTNHVLQGLMMVAIHGPKEDFDFNEALRIWGNLRKRHILLDRIKRCGDRNRELKSVVVKSMMMHKIVLERKQIKGQADEKTERKKEVT